MAHFAELNSDNIVLRVISVDNSMLKNNQGEESEIIGIDFLKSVFGQSTIWKQTSYNTYGGVYYDPQTGAPSPDLSKAFRKNYAGIGYTYDLIRDAFINPKPEVPQEMQKYLSFDEFACLWKYNPPIEEFGVTRV